jgi:hypothetical protein
MGENFRRHEGQVSRGRTRRDHRRADGIGRRPWPNPDNLTQYRINLGEFDRTLAIEHDLLVLTDVDGVALMVKQRDEYRRVVTQVTQQLQAVFTADRFVKAELGRE